MAACNRRKTELDPRFFSLNQRNQGQKKLSLFLISFLLIETTEYKCNYLELKKVFVKPGMMKKGSPLREGPLLEPFSSQTFLWAGEKL